MATRRSAQPDPAPPALVAAGEAPRDPVRGAGPGDPLDGFAIDRAQPTPAYLQLAHVLAAAIRVGALRPGAALPSERDLADRVGLSRMTVRRAFETLAADGLVEQRQGSGTYVAGGTVEQHVDRVLGFADEARALGVRAGGRLLSATRRPAGRAAAAALGLDPGTEVLVVKRVRTADDEPLAVQAAHLPPALLDLDLAPLEAGGGLYDQIRAQFGLRPARARQTVRARAPEGDERELLAMERDGPILALERVTFDVDGVPFEYVRSAYRGDRYRLSLDLGAPEG